MTLDKLELYLKNIYCVDTCYPKCRDNWNEDNPTLGHCAIVSLIINDYLGGKIYKIKVTKDVNIPVNISEILNTMLVNSDGTYISSIALNTKANDFIDKAKKVDTNALIIIKNNLGEEKENEILSTGDKVTIQSGEEIKTFSVVVYGDINGDTLIDALDYVRIKNYIMNKGGLTDAFEIAADVNKDGKVDALDYVNVKNYIMGKYNIVQ